MADSRMRGLPLGRFPRAIEGNRAKRRIGVILFDGFPLLLAGAVVETFHMANLLAEEESNLRAGYEVHFLSTNGGAVSSASSVFVKTVKCEKSLHLDHYHAVFVAAGKRVNDARAHDCDIENVRAVLELADMVLPISHEQPRFDTASLEWLRPHVARTIETREWLHRLAGAASPVEVALRLVGRDLGGEIARRVAWGIEFPPHWHFGAPADKRAAAKFSEQIQTSARWLEANASRAISIDEAAEVALMSTRNFLRRFRAEIGMTPSEYLLHVRIGRCCRLLASTSLPMDKVARRCGFGSGGQLSRVFRKHLGHTPTEYRAKVHQPNVVA
jgi:transcriptional regulator GlxA family with amidase domain